MVKLLVFWGVGILHIRNTSPVDLVHPPITGKEKTNNRDGGGWLALGMGVGGH